MATTAPKAQEAQNVKVYVLTRGSYSDYQIVAIFADREKAEAAAELADRERDRCDVEAWEVTEELPAKVVIHTVSHHPKVYIGGKTFLDAKREGSVWVGLPWDWSGWGMPKPGVPFVKRRKGKTLDRCLLIVYAFDGELARRVFDAQWGTWEAEFAEEQA